MALTPAVINPRRVKSVDTINAIHWSRHLDPEFQVINLAQPGASNLMILSQLKDGLVMHRPTAVVLGFTSLDRMEFRTTEEYSRTHNGIRYFTSCNHDRMTFAQRQMHAGYLEFYPHELAHLREAALIEYTVLLARSQVPTVYSMGLAKLYDDLEWQKPVIFDPWQADLPLNLVDGDHWGPDDYDAASFHVKNPNDHLRFADQINKWLLTIPN